MIDLEIRALTVRPLTTTQRALVIEAFKKLDALDPWARALDQVRAGLKTFADNLDRS